MLKEEELKSLTGGAAITAAMLAGIISGVKAIADLARGLGTAIRRIQTNNLC